MDGDAVASSFIDETEAGRGRVDVGYRFSNEGGITASADVFFDGLGSNLFTTYGITLGLQLDF
ncbi:hypothetical protein P6F26_06935 [Roseibacterium sp. SDUM158017]|uniref:hypothetical protein n=1 Tax=Roseicyclus salinarum TaxID=3036773 RepID=UPI002414EC61|nr:hypothetical protein [Roseibacterium sp. SDUM158017]MDG4648173.1 hypothetical protein [Roseibacterium sp. SDUM158017]